MGRLFAGPFSDPKGSPTVIAMCKLRTETKKLRTVRPCRTPCPKFFNTVAAIGIDNGKNSFHVSAWMGTAPCAASEVVARSGRSAAGQYVALPDRHGGPCRCASPQPRAQGAWPRRPARRLFPVSSNGRRPAARLYLSSRRQNAGLSQPESLRRV
jgi:hypothetical protein